MTGFVLNHPCGYLLVQCGSLRHFRWRWKYQKLHEHCLEICHCLYIAWHWHWPPKVPV